MTAKSIVDVEVNDASFKDFVALFKEYKAQLAELPAEWNKVGKAVDASVEGAEALPRAVTETADISEDIVASFADMTAALMAQAEQHRKIASLEQVADAKRRTEREREKKAETEREKSQKRYEASVAKTNQEYRQMRGNIAGAVGGIASAAVDVLKWVGLGGIASGLIGAGGLFGLDRLASNAGESRRTAQGLDTSVGDLKAFSVNYQRAVDAGSYLSNIETVARTPGLQYGIGSDIARMQAEGNGTADIGAALIPLIKQTFQQYGANAYGLKASGLDNVVSLQEAIRISKLSDAEIAEIGAKFEKGKASLAISDQVAKDWQDLSVQLDNAGERIENVLIKDLDKLAPVIGHLSDKAVDLVDRLVTKAIPAIDDFASYLDSDDLKKDLKSGGDAVKAFADAAVEAARVLGIIDRPAPDAATASNSEISQYNLRNPDKPQLPLHPNQGLWEQARPGEVSPNDHEPFRWWLPDSYNHHLPGTAPWESGGNTHALGATAAPGRPEDWRSLHNMGSLFVPGGNQLLGFDSDEAGIKAIDKQLMLYEKRDHLDTIEKIITKYAPPSQNDTEAYIRNMVERTGFTRDQHLGDDLDTRARMVSGVTKQEHSNTNFTPAMVKVVIDNNTGGSAIVSTSQFPS